MNEENINNVVTYIQQNEDQPTETLVHSLLTAGYPLDDIKIGLSRLGLSPLALTDYTEPSRDSLTAARALIPKRELLAVAGAAIILMGVYSMGNTSLAKILGAIPFLGRQPQLNKPVEENKAAIPTEIKENPQQQNTASPVNAFAEKFNNSTLKITANSSRVEGAETVYYTENGFIDRVDYTDQSSIIVRTTAYFAIDHQNKTFTKTVSTDFLYGSLINELQYTLSFYNLLKGNPRSILWENTGTNEWKARDTESNYTYIISFNDDHLPMTLTELNTRNEVVTDMSFEYEHIRLTDEMLSVPKGYKEINTTESHL